MSIRFGLKTGCDIQVAPLRFRIRLPLGANFWAYVKKITSLCLVRSRVTTPARHSPAWESLKSGQF
jgi:hypothetical protein